MTIVGGTYVGGNPVDEQMSRSYAQAGANVASGLQRQADRKVQYAEQENAKSKASFLALDEQLKALVDAYGSDVFKPDSPYFKEASGLLQGASEQYNRAYGGKPSDYTAAFMNRPINAKTSAAYDVATGRLPDNRVPPPGGTVTLEEGGLPVGYNGGGGGGVDPRIVPMPRMDGGLEANRPVADPSVRGYQGTPAPAPAPAVPQGGPPVQGYVPNMDPYQRMPQGALPGAPVTFSEEARGRQMAQDAAFDQVNTDMAAQAEAKKQASAEKKILDQKELIASKARVSVQELDAQTAQFAQDQNAVKSMLDRIKKNPDGMKAMYDFAMKRLSDPKVTLVPADLLVKTQYEAAQKIMNTPAGPAMTAGPANPPAPSMYAGTLRTHARGTGMPQMSPGELARHEAMTGDTHIPALIGVKEGVVNARAMEAGGDALVRRLNQAYPVFADGTNGMVGESLTQGDSMWAPAAPAAPMSQEDLLASDKLAQLNAYADARDAQSAPGQTYQGPPMQGMPVDEPPPPEIATGPGGQPTESAADPRPVRQAALTNLLEQMAPPPPEPKKSTMAQLGKMASLVAQRARAAFEGQEAKQKALTVQMLAEERKALQQRLGDPAFRAHSEAVRNNIQTFLRNADDEQLAYYGFDTVLKAKQDKKKFEEEQANNTSARESALMQKKLYQAQLDAMPAEQRYKEAQGAFMAKQGELIASQIGDAPSERTLKGAQARYYDAQAGAQEAEALWRRAQAQAIKDNPKLYGMEETTKQMREWMGTFKGDVNLMNDAIKKNVVVKNAFDVYAKALGLDSWEYVTKEPWLFGVFGLTKDTVMNTAPEAPAMAAGATLSPAGQAFDAKFGN